jgi:ATP-dependent Clp protease ATP-binding subunit ClpA
MFSQHLEITLNLAYNNAKEQNHKFLTVEHLLLALLTSDEILDIMMEYNVDTNRLKSSLNIFINETTPQIAKKSKDETHPTLEFQRILQRAIFQVQASGSTEVSVINILGAMFSEQDTQAIYLLKQENFTRLDIMNHITHGKKQQNKNNFNMEDFEPNIEESIIEQNHEESALEKYTVNLNKKALNGKIDKLIGREFEIDRTVQILSRRKKNNPLFVGEPGVGKTAIAEGLAYRIACNLCPSSLQNATIFSLDLGAMLAGTKYRGDFEKRFYAILKDLKKIANPIVFIDEIHTLIGAGAAAGGAMDAANLIKPLLSNGGIKCMGATTYQEYRNILSKDKALSRRFQKIDVNEPSVDESIIILQGIKKTFEDFHKVQYSDEAIAASVKLSKKYITDRFLPDKAIDIIDEVGANFAVHNKQNRLIQAKDVESTVAKIARIPEKRVSRSDSAALSHLERDISTMVFGQNEAISSLTNSIKVSRSGLRKENKPIGSFLFSGPTGVGKTEVAIQLARSLNLELVRFDMSEYMEKHSSSQLIGAPAGYVGYDQGGLLAEAITKNPHSVLLLDEIDKAHPDICNILLQIMDHATCTDNNGRIIDFRHVIVIMTCNTGATELIKHTLGFGKSDNLADNLASINSSFSPEFRNRLDKIVQFNSLTPRYIIKIVNKFLTELEVQLEDKNIELEVTTQTKKWLCLNGIDANMGARPMERLIQNTIKSQLADEILFGKLKKGGKVTISLDKNEVVIASEKCIS